MSGSVLEITDPQFEQEVLSFDQVVLVYFWAPWCGPCRLVSPSISWVAQEYGDRLKVVKLEVDQNPDAVKTCQVEGVPALRLFKGGEIIDTYEGAVRKEFLANFVNKHV